MPSKFAASQRITLAALAIAFLFTLSLFIEFHPSGRTDSRDVVDDVGEAIARVRADRDLNVLFILIDTLRADHLGSYGYERRTSPFLDSLGSGGIRFSRHLAQSSWTKSSMASLWTGLYPPRNGVTRFDDVIPEDALMPAEMLSEANFRTVGLFRNGWVSPTFGFEQGFDVYTRPAPLPLAPQIRLENPTISNRTTDESATAAAIEFLRIYRDEPWFLYLHLMDVHEYLYDEETAIFGSDYVDKYDNSILWTDGTLEVLFDTLDRWGLTKKTLVVITSDHGEAFRERGYEGHARQLFKESTEVPWIISLPTRLSSGIVVDTRTQNVDVWQTILDLIGLPDDRTTDGRSRVPEILAAAEGQPLEAEEHEAAFAFLDQTWGQRDQPERPSVAVVDGSLRYVRRDSAAELDESLFDANVDPSELVDVSEQSSESRERLRLESEAFLELEPPWGEVPTRELQEMELNQLRALGYSIP